MSESTDVERALAVPEPRIDRERALERLRSRIRSEGLAPATHARRTLPHAATRWLGGLAAAAVTVLVVTMLTVSGLADTILTIFEPKQFVAVPVTRSDIQQLGTACVGFDIEACIGAYGTWVWNTKPTTQEVASLDAAKAASGLAVLAPATLPSSISGPARYAVIGPASATFTFSADATRASAAKLNRTPPPLPANIDGSKLFISGGPAVLQVYGARQSAAPPSTSDPLGSLPTLLVAQAKAPTVSSNGVTVAELQAYLLAQPGISPQLATAIRSIGDPASTLPVPVPTDFATTHRVTVQGVDGLFVGDATGIASAVIWQKGGLVFEVFGALTESQVLAVANSLR